MNNHIILFVLLNSYSVVTAQISERDEIPESDLRMIT